MFEVCDLEPWHVMAIERQPSQRTQLGIPIEHLDQAEAEAMANEAVTAAFLRDGKPIGVMGVAETFPGKSGVAWAIFAPGLGRDHLAITREARRRLDQAQLGRIEAVAPCVEIERFMGEMPDASPVEQLRVALHPRFRTPEIRWAMALGFKPAHVLRKFGAAAETHMLLERIS